MSSLTDKKEEIKDMRTAGFIAGVLCDISAMNIQKIRENFKKNKLFYKEISDLYRLVKLQSAYAKQNISTDINNDDKQKVLAVAITSNKRFYGSLNNDVMEFFLKYTEEQDDMVSMIIGATGRQFLVNHADAKQFEYAVFGEDNPSPKEIDLFLSKTNNYDKVLVFYPSFINMFKQAPVMVDITYTPEIKNTAIQTERYILEPELFEIVKFFETRVKHMLFKRTMLETELARTATRVMRMSMAENRASVIIKKRMNELKKESRVLSNARLLETFAGLSKWKKT